MSQNKDFGNNIRVTAEDFQRESKIEKNFDLVKRDSDDRFGDIAIIKNKITGDIAMLKESVSNNEREASRDILQVKRRLILNHPYMQKMLDFSCHKQSNFCSKFYKVRGFYEYPRNDLRREIMHRKKHLKEFSHEELTHIAYQILLALEYLQDNNIAFGDLRPSHISVDNKSQEYKLLDRLNDPSSTLQSQLNNIMARRPLYCSPNIFHCIKSNKKKLRHDPFKSDCFSLGLVLLEAGTLDNLKDIYDDQNGCVDEIKLEDHLNLFRGKYEQENALLCDLTQNLLTIDEEDRFNPKQFNEELPPYDEIIEHFNNNPIGSAQQEPEQDIILEAEPECKEAASVENENEVIENYSQRVRHGQSENFDKYYTREPDTIREMSDPRPQDQFMNREHDGAAQGQGHGYVPPTNPIQFVQNHVDRSHHTVRYVQHAPLPSSRATNHSQPLQMEPQQAPVHQQPIVQVQEQSQPRVRNVSIRRGEQPQVQKYQSEPSPGFQTQTYQGFRQGPTLISRPPTNVESYQSNTTRVIHRPGNLQYPSPISGGYIQRQSTTPSYSVNRGPLVINPPLQKSYRTIEPDFNYHAHTHRDMSPIPPPNLIQVGPSQGQIVQEEDEQRPTANLDVQIPSPHQEFRDDTPQQQIEDTPQQPESNHDDTPQHDEPYQMNPEQHQQVEQQHEQPQFEDFEAVDAQDVPEDLTPQKEEQVHEAPQQDIQQDIGDQEVELPVQETEEQPVQEAQQEPQQEDQEPEQAQIEEQEQPEQIREDIQPEEEAHQAQDEEEEEQPNSEDQLQTSERVHNEHHDQQNLPSPPFKTSKKEVPELNLPLLQQQSAPQQGLFPLQQPQQALLAQDSHSKPTQIYRDSMNRNVQLKPLVIRRSYTRRVGPNGEYTLVPNDAETYRHEVTRSRGNSYRKVQEPIPDRRLSNRKPIAHEITGYSSSRGYSSHRLVPQAGTAIRSRSPRIRANGPEIISTSTLTKEGYPIATSTLEYQGNSSKFTYHPHYWQSGPGGFYQTNPHAQAQTHTHNGVRRDLNQDYQNGAPQSLSQRNLNSRTQPPHTAQKNQDSEQKGEQSPNEVQTDIHLPSGKDHVLNSKPDAESRFYANPLSQVETLHNLPPNTQEITYRPPATFTYTKPATTVAINKYPPERISRRREISYSQRKVDPRIYQSNPSYPVADRQFPRSSSKREIRYANYVPNTSQHPYYNTQVTYPSRPNYPRESSRQRVELTHDGDTKIYRYLSSEKDLRGALQTQPTTLGSQRRESKKSIRVISGGQEIDRPLIHETPRDKIRPSLTAGTQGGILNSYNSFGGKNLPAGESQPAQAEEPQTSEPVVEEVKDGEENVPQDDEN